MVEMKEGRKGSIPVAAEAAGSALGVGSGRLGMVLRTGISAETDRHRQMKTSSSRRGRAGLT